MNKTEIDKRDQRFTHKITHLRKDLVERQQAFHNTPRKRGTYLTGFLLIFVSLILIYMVILPSDQKEKTVRAVRPNTDADPAVALNPNKPDEPALPFQETRSTPQETNTPTPPAEPSRISSAPTAEKTSPGTVQNHDKSMESVLPNSPALNADAQPIEQPFYIADSMPCKAVKNRLPVGKQHTFSIRETRKPIVWMDVRSARLPQTLNHVYYLNGERHYVVPLEIIYPRMRTWSYVTMRNEKYIGLWRVDITTEDGTVLEQIVFEVTP